MFEPFKFTGELTEGGMADIAIYASQRFGQNFNFCPNTETMIGGIFKCDDEEEFRKIMEKFGGL